MRNQGYFDIRETLENHRKEAICPSCGDKFTALWLAVHNVNNEPICDLCAWETASRLANLLFLSNAFDEYSQHSAPAHILEALRQRKSDPKRLKKELQEALDSLDNYGHGAPVTSPLKKLVMGQVKAALKSKNIETMKEARGLVEEIRSPMPNLDDEIPF